MPSFADSFAGPSYRHTLKPALLAAVAALTLAGCGGPNIVQYPPGSRPCPEALAAVDTVLLLQLRNPPGPNDPDGEIRDALHNAREVLTTHRAGESSAYSAATYHALADNVAVHAARLVDVYEREDPDTPYTDATDYYAVSSGYAEAVRALSAECQGTTSSP